MFKDLPKELVNAVASINHKSRISYAEEQKLLSRKAKEKMHTMLPKQPEPVGEPAAHPQAKKMAEETDLPKRPEHGPVKTTMADPLVVVEKKGNLHTHANLSVANYIHGMKVKAQDVHKGPVKVGDLKVSLSKHHASAMQESMTEMSHQEKTTMKHIKKPTAGEKTAAKDIKPGIAGYADRIAMLKSAEKEDRLKEETVAEGSTPRNEKEKQLAKLHGDPTKITHGDVLKGRGVKKNVKEAWEDMLKAAQTRKNSEKKDAGTGKFDVKKVSTGTVYTRKSSTFDDGGKDADMKKADKKMKQEAWEDMLKTVQARKDSEKKDVGTGKFDVKKVSTGTVYTRKASTFDDGGKDADMKKADKKIKQEETIKEYYYKPHGEVHGTHGKGPSAKVSYSDAWDDYKVSFYHDGIQHRNTNYSAKTAEDAHKKAADWMKNGPHTDKQKPAPVKEAKTLRKFSAYIEEATQTVHPNALHVSDAGGGKYKVHAVGKNFAHGIKVGEHLTDSHLDDFAEMGGKIKHIASLKPKKP